MEVNLSQLNRLAFSSGKQYRHKNVAIGLSGSLGSGKTTFVKSFAKAFGVRIAKSPTFVILNVYPGSKCDLYHFDFYRLHHASQLQPLGIREIFGKRRRIILIEWVEKFPSVKKQCNLIIKLKIIGKNKRRVNITKH